MKTINKLEKAYKTISEVAEILNLRDKKSGKLNTHTIRFWEKNFKQIKPKVFNSKRRYYDQNSIEMLKKIKFLLSIFFTPFMVKPSSLSKNFIFFNISIQF